MKKIISFIFVLIMCFSCFTLTVFAEEEPSTTEDVTVEDVVEETYTITYVNYGLTNKNPDEYVYGTEVVLNAPIKIGYVFKGWYEDEEKTILIEKIDQTRKGNLTLYADWELKKYEINFDSNGGETVETLYYIMASETLTLPVPVRDGYVFKGWYQNDLEVKEIIAGSHEDYNLVAKWEEIVYPCVVNVVSCDCGEVINIVEKGNVGDVVTFKVKPYALFKVTSVKVNGVDLIVNENGDYTFALVEGNNDITVQCEVDDKQLEIIAINLANIKDGNWENIFSIDNLYKLIDWVITIFFSCGFLTVLLKNKKVQAKTTDDVIGISKQATKDEIDDVLTTFLENKFAPIITKIDSKLVGTEEVCKTLARCFILSQENTPEARLTIISELVKLQKTEDDLTSQVKAVILEEVKKMEEIQKKKEDTIKELEEKNDAIDPEIKDSGRI